MRFSFCYLIGCLSNPSPPISRSQCSSFLKRRQGWSRPASSLCTWHIFLGCGGGGGFVSYDRSKMASARLQKVLLLQLLSGFCWLSPGSSAGPVPLVIWHGMGEWAGSSQGLGWCFVEREGGGFKCSSRVFFAFAAVLKESYKRVTRLVSFVAECKLEPWLWVNAFPRSSSLVVVKHWEHLYSMYYEVL